jgi:hypothetical protein
VISRMEPYVTSRASFVPDPPRHPPSIVSECVGCESIKHCELEAVKNDLAPHATVLYEKLEADTTRFTDPLAYLFLAPPPMAAGVPENSSYLHNSRPARSHESQHLNRIL